MEKSLKEEQFLQAFDTLSDTLFRHVYFRVSDKEVAKDMVQDVFLKTWKEIEKVEEIHNIKAFLYKVTNNLIIDYYRKSKSSSLDNLTDDGFDPKGADESGIIAFAELGEAMNAMEKLSLKDRQVLVLRHIDGLSIKEISEQVGDSENVVSVRIHRATSRLKSIIGYE